MKHDRKTTFIVRMWALRNVFLVGNGGPKPQRVHWRTPSFINLQALPVMSKNHYVADAVGIVGSIDIVLGDVDR